MQKRTMEMTNQQTGEVKKVEVLELGKGSESPVTELAMQDSSLPSRTTTPTAPNAAGTTMVRPRAVPSPELQEKLLDARESLETLDSIKFPVIRFKDGKFILNEGEEPVESFMCTIVYTKQSNVYYKGRYDATKVAAPDCYSSDGKTPEVEFPVSANCRTCPLNQYNSAKDGGKGKACKNTRPLFVLVGDSILPRILRVPPTSLKMIESYITGVTADHGSYANVTTKISAFKKDTSQTYYNIKLQKCQGAFTAQLKEDNRAVRDLWIDMMKNVDVAQTIDDDDAMDAEVAHAPEQGQPAGRSF